jgi:hypothetical protein
LRIAKVYLGDKSKWMPLYTDRLARSIFMHTATNEQLGAAFRLWITAWGERPAGSVPNDRRWLADVTKLGDRWRPLRLNQKAVLIPVAQFSVWHQRASATPGLTNIELAVLAAIAGYYQRCQEWGCGPSLSFMRLANANDTEPKYIRFAVRHLTELCLTDHCRPW